MKVTVREVARAANVSIGTVSRVINRHPSVGAQNIDRVNKTISSLNYRALRQRRPKRPLERPLDGKNIALVLLGMDHSLAALPVVASTIHGAEAALARAGASMYLVDAPDLSHMPPALEHNRLDGVILKGALQGDAIGQAKNALMDKLRSLPTAWILGRPEGCCWGDIVGANDLAVGRLAADRLLASGHRRLAFLNPKPDHVTFKTREMSFAWHARQQADVRVERIVGTHPERWELPLKATRDVASVQELVDRLLALPQRPTALFAPADSIAALVYRALAARQLQVGRDISLISSNNERTLGDGLFPALTTIDTHAERIGARAVEQLAWRMEHGTIEPAIELNIEPALVEGDSIQALT